MVFSAENLRNTHRQRKQHENGGVNYRIAPVRTAHGLRKSNQNATL